MIVTDKEYFLENKLLEKLDLMVKRLGGTDDCVVTIDGDEGMGKTNIASAICYYIAYNTKRVYNVDNIFFDLDKLINYASKTKEQIIHWDEAALGGLSTQWWKQNQGKFMQLLMIARKKKHFIVMCIPKFNYLREYFFVDRSIALIHVYARQNLHKGRFFYFTKRKKEALFEYWKRRRVRLYIKFKSFGGTFPKAMEKIFSPEELAKYEGKKDYAIISLAAPEKVDKNLQRLKELELKMYTLPGITQKKMAEHFGIREDSMSKRKIRLQNELNKIPIPID